MKISIILLISVTCILASYTVENKSITVGYTCGNAAEKLALEKTIAELGFIPYESMTGTACDFAMHHCQVVFNYHGSNSVSGWLAQMNMCGRGYIQCSNTGWQFFCAQRFTLDENGMVTVYDIMKDTELTGFPNAITGGWCNAHGLASYSEPCHDYLANCTESMLPILGSTSSSDVNCIVNCPRALTEKKAGPGQGVFYGWCNYGDKMTSADMRLTENAIIFAAQPPHTVIGGPYTGVLGGVIHFDASKSYDNVAIVLYEWDFDGDGEFDLKSTKPEADVAFNKPYLGPITLRCTDNIMGRSNADTKLTVTEVPFRSQVQVSTLGEIRATFH